jgi:hypothetical protein
MVPIIEEVGAGFHGPPVGYLTQVHGLPRAKVRSASYVRCVPVDFSHGEAYGDRQYADVFFETFLDRHLKLRSYDLDKGLERLGFRMARSAWGPELWTILRSLVEDDSGARARELCKDVFLAARTAWNDLEVAEQRRRENRWRNYFKFKGSVRLALKNGFSVSELKMAINEVVVEDVMNS